MTEVLRQCKLIVGTKVSWHTKHDFEALNRTLRDIQNNNRLMGDVTVPLAGDFRQTLPVEPRGSRGRFKAAHYGLSFVNSDWKINMKVHL